jgi:hypothetical protein
MTTYSIPPSEWRAALDRFSLTHQGWPVTIEILSPAMGAQPEVIELPLSGISLSAQNDDPAIAVTMSRHEPDHITHVVEHVRRIYVDHEAGEAFAVEAADGTRTLLRFLKPAADAAFTNTLTRQGRTAA